MRLGILYAICAVIAALLWTAVYVALSIIVDTLKAIGGIQL